MRILYTTAILAMALHLPAALAQEESAPLSAAWEKSAELADLTAHFSGTDALPRLKELLEQGTDANMEDARGETALLLLCQSLEWDYRYRNEPHYSNAVDQAIILLLQNKADAMHENKNGCNAMFYIQGKPQLVKKLTEQKLLPPELAVRIPHEEMALLRYMRKRTAQADLTTNAGSLAYLSRCYGAPGYDRALKLLQKYYKAEMCRDIPSYAMETTLAFLRMAKQEEAEKYINNLPIWKHSEHFLEEVPAHFLKCLDALEWKVKPTMLQTALDRLDSLLPKTEAEMIECNVAPPMCHLLTMLDRQSGPTPSKQLERFARSRDNRLAYTALCLQLRRKQLPCPDPETLLEALHAEQSLDTLSEAQRNIAECALVDSAIRNTDLSALDAGMVRRVSKYLADSGLKAHAELLDGMTDEEGISISETGLSLLAEDYNALSGQSPQVFMARYILNHPATFATAKPEDGTQDATTPPEKK